MKSYKSAFLCFVLLSLAFPVRTFSQGFSGNPLPDSQDTAIIGQFMQIDNVSMNNVHPANDISAFQGNVFPPISSGSCVVHYIGDDWIWLRANGSMSGYPNALCLLKHINVASDIVEGASYSKFKKLGTTNSQNHLHVEIFLSMDSNIDSLDLKHPQRYALDDAPYMADSTDPSNEAYYHIYNIDAPAGQYVHWQVFAWDSIGDLNNGIGGAELLVNNVVVDSFDFDKYLSKNGTSLPTWQEFYYNDSAPPPGGSNNPSVINYRLSWLSDGSQESSTWRINIWDGIGNTIISDDHRFAAVEFDGELEARVENERVYLNWRVKTTEGIQFFNVYRASEEHGAYSKINADPVFTDEGQLAYEFVTDMPANWANAWFRLGAASGRGTEYMIDRKVSVSSPLISSFHTSPNPQKSGDNFNFRLHTRTEGHLEIAIFDARGRKIRTIYEGHSNPGSISSQWDGRTDSGSAAAAGVYLVRVSKGKEQFVRKIALIR